MGLFDEALNMAKSQMGDEAEGQSGLMGIVMQLINNPQSGGLAGLLSQLSQGGLGTAVSSWVGTGENQPVSGDAIQQALGSDKIQELAAQAGISTDALSAGLAQLLPGVVDKLTPNGEVPSGDLMQQGEALLKGKLFG
ncbi:MAG: YidB family protein [Sulfuriferula sp.]